MYRGASKKEKRGLLDQFVTATGYSRWYARFVLAEEVLALAEDQEKVSKPKTSLSAAFSRSEK